MCDRIIGSFCELISLKDFWQCIGASCMPSRAFHTEKSSKTVFLNGLCTIVKLMSSHKNIDGLTEACDAAGSILLWHWPHSIKVAMQRVQLCFGLDHIQKLLRFATQGTNELSFPKPCLNGIYNIDVVDVRKYFVPAGKFWRHYLSDHTPCIW